MRYFAGFIGGVTVAVLLLAFQQNLIGGEREYRPRVMPPVVLDRVFESRPPEEKPYEPREAPPEPEPLVKPELPVEPQTSRTPRPVPLNVPTIEGVAGYGTGPNVRFGGGSGVADGSVTVRLPVEPHYPPAAARNGVEGEVELEFTVRPDGSVVEVEVVRAEPRGVFEQSALRAIRQWQFIPKRRDGQPVSVRARQVIRFELPDRR